MSLPPSVNSSLLLTHISSHSVSCDPVIQVSHDPHSHQQQALHEALCPRQRAGHGHCKATSHCQLPSPSTCLTLHLPHPHPHPHRLRVLYSPHHTASEQVRRCLLPCGPRDSIPEAAPILAWPCMEAITVWHLKHFLSPVPDSSVANGTRPAPLPSFPCPLPSFLSATPDTAI